MGRREHEFYLSELVELIEKEFSESIQVSHCTVADAGL